VFNGEHREESKLQEEREEEKEEDFLQLTDIEEDEMEDKDTEEGISPFRFFLFLFWIKNKKVIFFSL